MTRLALGGAAKRKRLPSGDRSHLTVGTTTGEAKIRRGPAEARVGAAIDLAHAAFAEEGIDAIGSQRVTRFALRRKSVILH